MKDNYADVQQSFNRCLMRRDFLRRFYTVFIDSDDRIAEKFKDTDWGTQVHLLRHGISASLLYASGGDLGDAEVIRLARSHSPKGYDIPSWMYDNWLESLIATVRETDTKMDERLEQRWREALAPAIKKMKKGR